MHDVEGASRILDGELLDARWRDASVIVAIAADGRRRWYRDGAVEIIGEPARRLLEHAAIAAGVDEVLVIGGGVRVESLDGDTRWTLDGYKHPGTFETKTNAILSSDGKLVAIAYETKAEADYRYRREAGRGWVVFDTIENELTDRQWLPMPQLHAQVALAFCGKSKRLAIATPDVGISVGAIRVGRDEKYPRSHLGGARAVALDDRGVLAAYAYPKSITEAPRRLRVDYLEPGAKGGAAITILDTLWIDPAIDDIVALAFDAKSRRIACVDATGRLDIVPVP